MSAAVQHLQRRPWRVLARAGALVLLLGAIGLGAACSKGDEVKLNATQTAGPAPSVTATATPTPKPPPTPTATPISLADAAFPPPPPLTGTPPKNEYGIKRIVSSRLHLDNYVESVPVLDNQMQTPVDASYAVGYYPDFTILPGESGNAIFSAHETWQHMQGPFFALHRAEPGDDIWVQMDDGREFLYEVVSYKRYEVDTMPMAEIINPPNRPFGEAWITLITCGGRIVYDETGFGDYLDRDVVVARLSEP